MSEQVELQAQQVDQVEEKLPSKQEQKASFKEYKQTLTNQVEILELRARIAKASFEELAAANQYNQLRAALEARVQDTPKEDPTPQDEPEVNTTPTAEVPQEEVKG